MSIEQWEALWTIGTATDVAARVQLLKVIADETRLRILGLLAEKERTGVELADLLELSAPTVSHHMRKLTSAGIVTGTDDAQRVIYRLNASLLRDVKRGDDPQGFGAAPTDDREKTLRNFFDGERLKAIPAKRKQRVIVLQKLMERFEPGRQYPEREVNDLLRMAHDDVATLRRELVDYGFMVRENGDLRGGDVAATSFAAGGSGDHRRRGGMARRVTLRHDPRDALADRKRTPGGPG